ncbi:uncharacterized protein BP01DRAFT_81364 [Aspergillus saccharolyticus JOP 1030-1]|uniref:Uncharacterized protein n=1 Tax=Aspergillus saccharolyticus JOP 1030-1 TaxID=1450539 RepID=A0A318ZDK1_9EURO|nr:hypothetical protein BP01DRAFT_81364 [Aspergillus saccharolyticus JOP 1030-1]PYH44374.1 hypothetical protein BP01DRAFT_81364 [Aspergillus saccharolyticus JOP 1030-1]
MLEVGWLLRRRGQKQLSSVPPAPAAQIEDCTNIRFIFEVKISLIVPTEYCVSLRSHLTEYIVQQSRVIAHEQWLVAFLGLRLELLGGKKRRGVQGPPLETNQWRAGHETSNHFNLSPLLLLLLPVPLYPIISSCSLPEYQLPANLYSCPLRRELANPCS